MWPSLTPILMLMIRLTDNKSPRFHTHGLKFVLVKYMMAATFRKFINVVVKSRMIDHPTLLQRESEQPRWKMSDFNLWNEKTPKIDENYLPLSFQKNCPSGSFLDGSQEVESVIRFYSSKNQINTFDRSDQRNLQSWPDFGLIIPLTYKSSLIFGWIYNHTICYCSDWWLRRFSLNQYDNT